jgi:hypothetical protein
MIGQVTLSSRFGESRRNESSSKRRRKNDKVETSRMSFTVLQIQDTKGYGERSS